MKNRTFPDESSYKSRFLKELFKFLKTGNFGQLIGQIRQIIVRGTLTTFALLEYNQGVDYVSDVCARCCLRYDG